MGVIQFVNPIWLAAAAVVVVPVILHLRNDRRGKVLRVGSVELLTGGVQRMAWRRRVSDWVLLLMRCLLLLALAVLMAGPVLRTGVKGWVLGSGRVADSLVKAGWEKHAFRDSLNYWEEFRLADREAPAGVLFYVRTPGLARRFGGERPVTDRDVRWDVDLAGDSVSRWTQAAWVVAGDSDRVVEGVSRATGTAFHARTVARTAVRVAVDTSVLRVAVVPDSAYRRDARYVNAALAALQKYTLRRMAVVAMGAGGYNKLLDYGAWKKGIGDSANDLLWSGAFPVWMEKLLFVDSGAGTKDLRVLDPEQVVPLAGGRTVAGAGGKGGRNLETEIWAIVILLFIIERILSHGKKKA
jgi:hypothetical protein